MLSRIYPTAIFVIKTFQKTIAQKIMLSKIYSAAIFGLETTLIEVKVDVSNGLHSFSIIVLPDISI